ncbi:MAG: hypothetical protein INR69_13010 [Mucilaginibacter polytrichastri]|nr:hypothetical protein [Mucilaginibacter polytrichastri]
MDIEVLIFLIIVGVIGLILLAIPYVGLYFMYKWLTKKGYKKVGLSLIIAFTVYSGYSTYTAIYPTDSFYFSEFKKVTLREAPKSATVINKQASYPDFHGDYCSASLITMSNNDYSTLLKELNNDKRITKNKSGEITGSSELYKVMGDLKTKQIIHSFKRSVAGHEDHYLYIGFLVDKRTIVLSVCVT